MACNELLPTTCTSNYPHCRLFLLLSPDILELIFMLHFLKDFSVLSQGCFRHLCWAIINADCLGCSFCSAVILLGGAEGVAP